MSGFSYVMLSSAGTDRDCSRPYLGTSKRLGSGQASELKMKEHGLSYCTTFKTPHFVPLHCTHPQNVTTQYLNVQYKDPSDTSPAWWPRGLRRGSAAASWLGLRVRIPQGARIFVLCVVRERSLRRADHRPEESCRVWCV